MTGHETTRRDLLLAAGAAGVGTSILGGCHGEDPFALTKPAVPGAADWARGEERYVATACGQCGAGCGIQVRVVEGRAVKVEGLTSCPINRGGVGPRGLSAPQVLYDPDRIREPLRRTGSRGSGGWEPIGWDEAIALLAGRLGALRERAESHRLGILSGRERGFLPELWRRFAEAYGTPNLFDARSTNDGAQLAAMRFMQGVEEVPAYDWENTRLVLSLGSGVLDASCQLLHFVRARGHHRGGEGRARVVHVGSVHSRTAMMADEWIQARPGTHGAFALGMAHILVRDGLHDADFVEQHTLGFDTWTDAAGREHLGFAQLLEEYTPERVAKICELRAAKLEEIAARLAEIRPSFAFSGKEDLRASNGVQSALAVHALNALLGAIDRPGGLLVERPAPLSDWPEVEPDDVAQEGLAQPGILSGAFRPPFDALPARLLGEARGVLDTLLVYYANPVYARANPRRWREALAEVPYIVSFSPFFDETTAEFADLILPDESWLERWEDSGAAPSQGRAVFTFRQPVVESLYATRNTADVLIGLAGELGDEVAAAFPFQDMKDAFKKRIIGLYKAKTGSIVESKGSDFLTRFYEEGFWYDESYAYEDWERVLLTESGRFEFFSHSLWAALEESATGRGLSIDELARELTGEADPDRLCLPGYRPLATDGDPARYPLLLLPYRAGNYSQGYGSSLPWLGELAAWRGRPLWCTEVELHPETARPLGIVTGDRVRVLSTAGQIEGLARLTVGVRREIVHIPQGGGHTAGGRYAKGWGANPMELVSADLLDPLGGSSPLQGTRVAIVRLES
jgi:anaerobic selenocysteine-containing dehydrogenase